MALFCAVSCCAHFQWPSGCDRNAFVDSRYVQVFTTFNILLIIGHHSWHAAVAGQLRPMHACVHTCNCAPVHHSYRSRTGHYFTLLAAPSRRRQAKCSQGQSCCGTCDKSCGSPRGLGKQGIFSSSDTNGNVKLICKACRHCRPIPGVALWASLDLSPSTLNNRTSPIHWRGRTEWSFQSSFLGTGAAKLVTGKRPLYTSDVCINGCLYVCIYI